MRVVCSLKFSCLAVNCGIAVRQATVPESKFDPDFGWARQCFGDSAGVETLQFRFNLFQNPKLCTNIPFLSARVGSSRGDSSDKHDQSPITRNPPTLSNFVAIRGRQNTASREYIILEMASVSLSFFLSPPVGGRRALLVAFLKER